MDTGEDRLPLSGIPNQPVRVRHLRCAFKPCAVAAYVPAILFESVPQSCLVMRLDIGERTLKRLRLGPQRGKSPGLDVQRDYVLGDRYAVLSSPCPELLLLRVPHRQNEMLCLLRTNRPSRGSVGQIKTREKSV